MEEHRSKSSLESNLPDLDFLLRKKKAEEVPPADDPVPTEEIFTEGFALEDNLAAESPENVTLVEPDDASDPRSIELLDADIFVPQKDQAESVSNEPPAEPEIETEELVLQDGGVEITPDTAAIEMEGQESGEAPPAQGLLLDALPEEETGAAPGEVEPLAEVPAFSLDSQEAGDVLQLPDLPPDASEDAPLLAEPASADANTEKQGLSLQDVPAPALSEGQSAADAETATSAEKTEDTAKPSSFETFLKERRQTESRSSKNGKSSGRKKSKAKGKNKHLALLNSSISLASLFENNKYVGLDIGSSRIKHVQLKKSTGGYKLIQLGSFAIEKPPLDANEDDKSMFLAQHIKKHLNPRQFKNALVTSPVSGLEVVFKNVQVPKLKKKEMAKAVPWACRKDLPFPIDSTQFQFHLISGKNHVPDGKVDVFVIAAQKKLVEQHLKVLKFSNIKPAKISTVPGALCALLKEQKSTAAEKCYMMVDIGSSSSHIVFINRKQVQFAREISTAGNDFTEALSSEAFLGGKEIRLKRDQAEKIKKKYGIPQNCDENAKTPEGLPLQEIAVMMGSVIERLSSEMQRTIEFYKEKFKVDSVAEIYVTGGGALLPNLAQVLQAQLNIPVTVFNPFERLPFKKVETDLDLKKIGPKYAVAVGLALDRGKELNLLPSQDKSSQLFFHVKRVFKYIFLIAILVMILLSQQISRQFTKVQKEFKQLNAQYLASQPRRKRFQALQKQIQSLSAAKAQLMGNVHIDLEAANHLRAISHLVPPHITLTNLKIASVQVSAPGKADKTTTEQVLTMIGVAFENNSMEGINLANFMLALEKSEYFRSIRIKSQKVREDGSMAFTIECVL